MLSINDPALRHIFCYLYSEDPHAVLVSSCIKQLHRQKTVTMATHLPCFEALRLPNTTSVESNCCKGYAQAMHDRQQLVRPCASSINLPGPPQQLPPHPNRNPPQKPSSPPRTPHLNPRPPPPQKKQDPSIQTHVPPPLPLRPIGASFLNLVGVVLTHVYLSNSRVAECRTAGSSPSTSTLSSSTSSLTRVSTRSPKACTTS